jgi:hypothetical protein
MTDGHYKDRIERGRQEEELRRRAIARDSEAYNPGKLKSKVPVGCLVVGILLAIAAAIVAAWLFRHLA